MWDVGRQTGGGNRGRVPRFSVHFHVAHVGCGTFAELVGKESSHSTAGEDPEGPEPVVRWPARSVSAGRVSIDG